MTTTAPPVNETVFTIRFAETDMAGVFHHSNMFVWFEVGRFALIDALTGGEPMIEVGGEAIFAPVTRTRVAFTGFGRFGDALRLETFLRPQETTKLVFYYRLTRAADGKEVAVGMTEHVVLTTGHRFLFRWPPHISQRMTAFFAAHPEALTEGGDFDGRL